MPEGTSPEYNQSTQPKRPHPTAQTIGHLRHMIDEKKEEARSVQRRSGVKRFTKRARRTTVNIAGELVRKELESETDPLTGLLNLQGYTRRKSEEIARAKTYGHPLTVAVLDANGLKLINDSQGHDAGDNHLRKIADVLRQSTRLTDTVARPGGDEFSVILTETDRESAELWKVRLDKAFEEAGVSVSVGLNQIDPNNPEESIKEADRRMYAEKRRQKERNSTNPI